MKFYVRLRAAGEPNHSYLSKSWRSVYNTLLTTKEVSDALIVTKKEQPQIVNYFKSTVYFFDFEQV